MDAKFGKDYWQDRYLNHATGWDIGHVSTPLKEYFDQLVRTDIHVLIPGAGNAYEAAYLWQLGFKNVDVLDVAEAPLVTFKQAYPDFPGRQLIQCDFFDHKGSYDLIVEQTFFCALEPSLRSEYVQKSYELLKPGGKIVGLLWNKPMNANLPPFGGSIAEYQELFSPLFNIDILTTSYNSIPPRAGNEVFIKFQKV